MSSPPKAKTETKGGHLPAVKAGGMRIVQKHQSEVPEKKDDKDSKEYETERDGLHRGCKQVASDGKNCTFVAASQVGLPGDQLSNIIWSSQMDRRPKWNFSEMVM